LEDEIAKSLLQLEINNAGLKEHLSQVFINSADLVEYKQADGSASKTLVVRIPFRSFPGFRKVAEKVVAHLESKFNWPVIVIANRTIISKHAKKHRTQKRPRSRTLTAVHAAVLEDICYPASITGRSTRVTLDGKKHMKVFLDPLDKEKIESKLDAIGHIYHKLTTHKISLHFSRPNSFQKKVLDAKKQ
jgi:small subunit ribosomal protein S7e